MAQDHLDWQVLLMDYTDTPLAELDAQGWDYERRVNQVGAAHLTLSPASRTLPDTWDLASGKWLQFRCRYQDAAGGWQTTREDWGGVLVTRTLRVPEAGAPAALYGLTAYDWKHYLRLRIIEPPAGLEFLALDNAHAGDAIQTAWTACVTNSGADLRAFNHVGTATTGLTGVGGAVAYSARYERLYDVVTSLAGQGAMKFDVARLPPSGGVGPILQLQGYPTLRGVDRTLGNGSVPAVVFSTDLQALSTLDYSEDASTLSNAIITGGQGDGAARVIATVVDAASAGLYERQEFFLDARGAATLGAVQAAGTAYLALHKDPELQMQFTLAQTGGPLYKRDWDLGDKVSVRLSEIGVTLDLEVTAVRVTSAGDPGARPTITPTLGTPRRNLVDRVGALARGLSLTTTH